jgi:hypothetical protein
MSPEEKWEQHLTVTSGKVWFEPTPEKGRYKVSALLDCESENTEPFKVWFEQVNYEPASEVPERETAFFVNVGVSKPQRSVRLTARRAPSGDPPPQFRDFCKCLVDSPEAHKIGYIFSTGDLRVRLTHEPLDQGEALQVSISDHKYGEHEGNFVRFAYFAKPFDLVPNPGLVDLSKVLTTEAFTDILKDQRLYAWPLDRE